MPGDVFAYNEITGPRTLAAGFLNAPAYVGGKPEDQVGGGICQVSSTTYYAVLLANLKVVERQNHSYAVGYVPIRIRSAVIPISQFGSSLSMPVLLVGLLFNYGFLVQLGIVLFSTVALFQLVTLPVEFNASARALHTLESSYILESDEVKMAGKVLRAAALTYVAALLSSLAQLLRLILLFGRRDRD